MSLRFFFNFRIPRVIIGFVVGGGIILVVADTLSRIIFAPIEMPVGITTSLIGGPVFLYLVLLAHRWVNRFKMGRH